MTNDDAIDPSKPLREAEERPIGVSVPAPLSKRLDRLVAATEGAGVRVYRKDLVAALILAAPEDPDELLKLYLRYRRAKASEAGMGDGEDATVLELQRPKPGRRPRPS